VSPAFAQRVRARCPSSPCTYWAAEPAARRWLQIRSRRPVSSSRRSSSTPLKLRRGTMPRTLWPWTVGGGDDARLPSAAAPPSRFCRAAWSAGSGSTLSNEEQRRNQWATGQNSRRFFSLPRTSHYPVRRNKPSSVPSHSVLPSFLPRSADQPNIAAFHLIALINILYILPLRYPTELVGSFSPKPSASPI
jgi:hypothetical protein